MPATQKRTVNWKEACDMLGCSRSYFYNLINSGRIPAFRIGKVKGIRVAVEDIMAFLESRRVE